MEGVVKKMQRLMRIRYSSLVCKRPPDEVTAADNDQEAKKTRLDNEQVMPSINIDMTKEQAVFDNFFGAIQPAPMCLPVAAPAPAVTVTDDVFGYFDADEYNLVDRYACSISEVLDEILPVNSWPNIAVSVKDQLPTVQPHQLVAPDVFFGAVVAQPECQPVYLDLPEMTPARIDDFVTFVKAMRIAPDQIMNDTDFIHCNKDNEYDEKMATRKENNALVNNDKIVQHRPIGSVTSKKYLPDELRTCPCDCAKRNPSSEIDLQGMLDAMVKRDYMRNGELLQLLLPPLIKNAVVKQVPPVIGIFEIETKNKSVEYWFKDLGSGEKHCCPIAWYYFTFVSLAGEGLISDLADMAEIIKVQMNLRNNCANFVSIKELNLSLYQLMKSYRHDIGMYRMGSGKDATRTRIALKNADDDKIPFKTREELKAFFADYTLEAWPDKTLWQDAQTRRIRLYEQQTEGYIATIRRLREQLNKKESK